MVSTRIDKDHTLALEAVDKAKNGAEGLKLDVLHRVLNAIDRVRDDVDEAMIKKAMKIWKDYGFENALCFNNSAMLPASNEKLAIVAILNRLNDILVSQRGNTIIFSSDGINKILGGNVEEDDVALVITGKSRSTIKRDGALNYASDLLDGNEELVELFLDFLSSGKVLGVDDFSLRIQKQDKIIKIPKKEYILSSGVRIITSEIGGNVGIFLSDGTKVSPIKPEYQLVYSKDGRFTTINGTILTIENGEFKAVSVPNLPTSNILEEAKNVNSYYSKLYYQRVNNFYLRLHHQELNSSDTTELQKPTAQRSEISKAIQKILGNEEEKKEWSSIRGIAETFFYEMNDGNILRVNKISGDVALLDKDTGKRLEIDKEYELYYDRTNGVFKEKVGKPHNLKNPDGYILTPNGYFRTSKNSFNNDAEKFVSITNTGFINLQYVKSHGPKIDDKMRIKEEIYYRVVMEATSSMDLNRIYDIKNV